MKCGHCGKDLMLAIEPRGLAKLACLWPFSYYRCVRCGRKNLGLSPAYQSTGTRIFLVLLILGAMGAAIWFAGLQKPGHGPAQDAAAQSGPAVRARAVPAPAPFAGVPETGPLPVNNGARPSGPGEEPLEQVALASPKEKVSFAPDETLTALQETLKKASLRSKVSFKEVRPALAEKKEPTPALDKEPPKPAPDKAPLAKAGTGQIKAIQTLATDTELVISLVAEGPLRTYTAFPLKDPPRFVIDVPGAWEYLGDKEISVHKFGVQKMRVGVHQDKMRIVLDLTSEKSKNPVIKPSPQGLFLVVE